MATNTAGITPGYERAIGLVEGVDIQAPLESNVFAVACGEVYKVRRLELNQRCGRVQTAFSALRAGASDDQQKINTTRFEQAVIKMLDGIIVQL